MKRILSAAVFGFLLLATAAHAQEKILVASEGSFPPFSKTESDGSLSGFEIDLGNAVCEKAKLQCEWVKQDFSGLMAGLIAGKFRMIFSSMLETDERRKVVDFSIPYYQTPNQFVGRKNSGIQITPEGLKGKVVGVYAGGSQEKYLAKTFPGVVETRGYAKNDQIEADLIAGRIDLEFNDAVAAAQFLESSSGREFEAVGAQIFDPNVNGAGAVFRKGDDDLRNKVDLAIKEVYASGQFDELSKKYLGAIIIRADKKWQ